MDGPPRPGTEGGLGAGSRQGRGRVDIVFFAIEALLVIMNVSQIKIDFSNAKWSHPPQTGYLELIFIILYILLFY